MIVEKVQFFRALDIFFNSKPITLDLFHKIHDNVQKDCEIQIKFFSLHKNDLEFPKQYIINDEVNIKKVFFIDDSNQIKSEILIKSFIFSQLELNDILL